MDVRGPSTVTSIVHSGLSAPPRQVEDGPRTRTVLATVNKRRVPSMGLNEVDDDSSHVHLALRGLG